MDLKQLEAFIKVIEYQSFTKAAQEMGLTQPTISAHISSLERELEVKLIIRTTKEVSLSKVGQVFYKHALTMIELREKSLADVKKFEADKSDTITIGVSNSSLTFFFPDLINKFLEENPKVYFNAVFENSSDIVEQVVKQQVEIGFVSVLLPTKKCFFEPFATDKLVIIAPNIAQYSTRGQSRGGTIAKLLSEPFVGREQGSGTRRKTEYLLRDIGFEPSRLNIISQFKSSEHVINSVVKGLGISIISNCVANTSPEKGKFLIFPIGKPSQSHNLFLVRNKVVTLSPAADKFYDFVLNSKK